MTSLLEGATASADRPTGATGDPTDLGPGSSDQPVRRFSAQDGEIGARIDGLDAAVRAGEGRLDGALVAEARAVADRAASRLKLSARHTVVGIAGATGSGKSSTFNALTGLDLSAVGVRRPTTSWATACVWGSEGAQELLEWLGIPPRHQTMRDSMLDTRREDGSLDGVVLLDLPDHDSTEVSHHLEVDRLVDLVDLLVWVLDPQKYADAAVHDRYLKPLHEHAGSMVVVLNHIDTVPEDRRQAMLDDVRRLLDQDGLAGITVIAVSAREGLGLDALREEIIRRVDAKRATRDRLEADVRSVASRLAEASGSGTVRGLPAARVETFQEALATAAGVPAVVDAVERSTRLRAARATGWPPVSWLGRFEPDPVDGLDLGDQRDRLTGRAPDRPVGASVQLGRVDAEVRALADDAANGMAAPWAAAVHRASAERVEELAGRLDSALATADADRDRLPSWVTVLRVLQWLLLGGVVGGAVWAGLSLAGVLDAPSLGTLHLPLALVVVCLVLGVVLGVVGRRAAAGLARRRAATTAERLNAAVAGAAQEVVVAPVQHELEAYAATRAGLAKALA